MKQENITLLKAWATATNNLERFVYLREDENGRYIEYAFIEGAPHDSRCLSWYDKLQPNALRRNGHDINKWSLHKVDEIYELHMMSCGNQDKTGDEHCSPGHHCKNCDWMKDSWTYDEPVKCACWILKPICEETIGEKYKLNMNEAVRFSKELTKEIIKSTIVCNS